MMINVLAGGSIVLLFATTYTSGSPMNFFSHSEYCPSGSKDAGHVYEARDCYRASGPYDPKQGMRDDESFIDWAFATAAPNENLLTSYTSQATSYVTRAEAVDGKRRDNLTQGSPSSSSSLSATARNPRREGFGPGGVEYGVWRPVPSRAITLPSQVNDTENFQSQVDRKSSSSPVFLRNSWLEVPPDLELEHAGTLTRIKGKGVATDDGEGSGSAMSRGSARGPRPSSYLDAAKQVKCTDYLTSLLRHVDPDGSERLLTFEEVKLAVGLEKHRRRTINRRTHKTSKALDHPALPDMIGLTRLPNIIKYLTMSQDEQVKWENAISLTHSALRDPLTQEEWNDKPWPATLLRRKLEPDVLVDKRYYTTKQMNALRNHRQRFDLEGAIGEVGTPEREKYMDSHSNLRRLGFPWPRPHIGHAPATLEVFKERKMRKWAKVLARKGKVGKARGGQDSEDDEQRVHALSRLHQG
ncbi:hypothetical protein CBS101457_003451 [Exobasidium rhododendri]|nr:hypothetical protein CBS101457_003451 [Exobasidium rhododendri]